MDKKYFTVEEANTVLKAILPLIERMSETVPEIQALADEVRPMFDNTGLDGGHPKGTEFMLIYKKFQEEIARIQSYGCVIKDPGMGLLDFPALRDGREIELCWRLGEDEIRFWHEVNAGYANRQPL